MLQRLRLIAAATALAVLVPGQAASAAERSDAAGGWRAAWTAAPHHPFPGFGPPNWSVDGFTGQSVRQVVRVGTGGATARIRLSNRFGDGPLRVTGATVGQSAGGPAVRPGSLRPVSFGRSVSVTVPAGGELVSDPAPLRTRALDTVVVTLYFAGATGPATGHENAVATSYRTAGDRRFDPEGRAFTETSRSWYFLTGVETADRPGPDPGVVVAFGDSITDGYGTTVDADNRYPDELAERLAAGRRPVSVVNAGISGNKLLADSTCFGAAGVSRFTRDALDQPGVRTVIVLIGINDIGGGGFPDFGCGASPVVTAAQVIEGHRRLIHAAHARGVRVVGATMLPIKGAYGYDTAANEAVRDEVNAWLRHSRAYDAVADLDRALADPAERNALRPAYDSGDHLHPNDAGAAVIARVVAPLVGGPHR
ncbi:SGNH/GDSL hydrolase family protein [Micromonospora sp. PLK6-60]|uniref:SGNH/GDSL hydrolase family protein n=1 Tax=Micromonospora sp. PLK6-60 TaxID=2873383 RepID=UPI001CA72135|nr:SGNH/GDSL hydrolase family protein [Micromonospora sp. PLK6-60]MBY8873116.1 SGNH/GDSL hydrolase family protein [Micromonospora sp. PLK6-60]